MNCICDKEKCTGCAACANACPTGAIKIEINNDGFLYPLINNGKCINCEKCKTICPEVNPTSRNRAFQVIKGYSRDCTILEKSTSGGIFLELAKQILQARGVVFGAVFNDDFSVSHYCAESYDQCLSMCGSKYIGSHIENSYSRVKYYLNSKRLVMFTGTPCQIAGLKNYLGKTDQSLLLTCDFVCHGVGSEKILKAYINHLENVHNCPVTAVYFRKKCGNYLHSHMVICFADGTHVKKPSYNNPFGYPFSVGKINRISCASCMYTSLDRASDITMSDLVHDLTENESKLGASMILINTDKGKHYIENCDIYTHPLTLEYALKIQPRLLRPQVSDVKRSEIFERVDNIPFAQLKNDYLTAPKAPFYVRLKQIVKKILRHGK